VCKSAGRGKQGIKMRVEKIRSGASHPGVRNEGKNGEGMWGGGKGETIHKKGNLTSHKKPPAQLLGQRTKRGRVEVSYEVILPLQEEKD